MIVQKLLSLVGFEVDPASTKEAEKAINTVKIGLGVVAGLAAAVSFKNLLFQATEALSESGNLATSFGLTTKEAQLLEYSLSTIGIASTELGGVLGPLNTKISELRQGNQGARAEFKLLGISMKDLEGLNTSQVFEKVAEGIKNSKDQTTAMAVASKLFGEGMATKLMPLLKNGAEGLSKLAKEGEGIGAIFTDEEIRQANEYKDGMTKLDATFKFLKRRLLVDLLPAATKVMHSFSEWYSQNKALVKLNMEAVVTGISWALKALNITLTWSLEKFGSLSERVGGAGNMFRLLGGIIASLAIAKTMLAFSALGKVAFMAGLKAQLPFLGVALLIALILAGVQDYQAWMRGEPSLLGEWFGPATGDNIKNITMLLTAVGGAIAIIIGMIFTIPTLIILIGALIIGLIVYWDELGVAFENMFVALFSALTLMWNTFVEEWKEGWNNAKSNAKWAIEKIADFLEDSFYDALDGIGESFEDLINWMLDKAEPLQSLIDGLGGDFNLKGSVTSLLGGGASDPSIDRQYQLDQRTNSAPISNSQVSVEKIEINGSGLSKQELQDAVSGGLDDASLRAAQANFSGGEI